MHHRTCFNNFFLVERWDPEAALRQKTQRLLSALRPRTGIKEIVTRPPYRRAVGLMIKTDEVSEQVCAMECLRLEDLCFSGGSFILPMRSPDPHVVIAFERPGAIIREDLTGSDEQIKAVLALLRRRLKVSPS